MGTWGGGEKHKKYWVITNISFFHDKKLLNAGPVPSQHCYRQGWEVALWQGKMTKPLREEAKFIGTQKDGGRGRQSLLCALPTMVRMKAEVCALPCSDGRRGSSKMIIEKKIWRGTFPEEQKNDNICTENFPLKLVWQLIACVYSMICVPPICYIFIGWFGIIQSFTKALLLR